MESAAEEAETDRVRGEEEDEALAPPVDPALHALSSSSSSPSPSSASSTAASTSPPGSPGCHEDGVGGQAERDLTLSEEAEEDLANNNDPNNNASDGLDPPRPNANLTSNMPHVSAAASPAGASAGTAATSSSTSSNNGELLPLETQLVMDDANEYVLEQLRELEKTEEERREELRAELVENARLVRKIFPKKGFDEVYAYLEAHHDKPNRVEIVIAEFVESTAVEDEDVPKLVEQQEAEKAPRGRKGKAGNGMKSKNRKKISKKGSHEEEEEEASKTSDRTVRKKPLLDLNLEENHRLMGLDNYFDDPAKNFEEAEKRTAAKRSHSEEDDAETAPKKSKGKGKGKGKSKSADKKKEVELTEKLLYGPFDFSAHRTDKAAGRPSSAAGSSSQEAPKKDFEAMREDLKKVLEDNLHVSQRSPEVVDLLSEERQPPPVVDISTPDHSEKRQLFENFRVMFPDTPSEYLEEQAEELAGKPAATDRFIEELIGRGCQPPDFWKPTGKPVVTVDGHDDEDSGGSTSPMDWTPVISAAQSIAAEDLVAKHVEQTDTVIADKGQEAPPEDIPTETNDQPQPAQPLAVETEEDKIASKSSMLQELFPTADPEFLHQKVQELIGDEAAFTRFVDESLENKGSEFPTREAYEKRMREAKMMEQYSQEVTAEEILNMYDDPEAYFSDRARKVSDLYKRHAVGQLKKEFRTLSAQIINKTLAENNYLYYLSYKKLTVVAKNAGKRSTNVRKSKRPDVECAVPGEIDINFLKEMQFARIEKQVEEYKKRLEEERATKTAEAKEKGALVECGCCLSDECLLEDMFYCPSNHMFCRDCMQRGSAVAIGDGKTSLTCMSGCDKDFELSTLQKALQPNVFSKWLRKIQLAEVEQADIEGLERCPFCEFANIMDTTPEENKVFSCQNPDCGKESCRLCGEISHIPLRCEEVEKDAEVRKRTYIENKMTEALIRKCWKCKKPFLKSDGCNKMTCECGASMCYLCRQPVRDYNHFYGQGAHATATQTCPLWSNSEQVHETDVARGALEARTEMEEKEPDVQLKHDPTKGVDTSKVAADEKENRANPRLIAGAIAADGLEGILGHDPADQERVVREQMHIEAMIRGQQRGGGGGGNARIQQVFGPNGPMFHHHHHNYHHQGPPVPPNPMGMEIHRDWNDGLMDRMGQLLQMREMERQRHRVMRQRERQALEDYQQQQQLHNNVMAHQQQQQPGGTGPGMWQPGPYRPLPVTPPQRIMQRNVLPMQHPGLQQPQQQQLLRPPVLPTMPQQQPPMAHQQQHPFGGNHVPPPPPAAAAPGRPQPPPQLLTAAAPAVAAAQANWDRVPPGMPMFRQPAAAAAGKAPAAVADAHAAMRRDMAAAAATARTAAAATATRPTVADQRRPAMNNHDIAALLDTL